MQHFRSVILMTVKNIWYEQIIRDSTHVQQETEKFNK